MALLHIIYFTCETETIATTFNFIVSQKEKKEKRKSCCVYSSQPDTKKK